jgi:hemolysin activation/secretion protein
LAHDGKKFEDRANGASVGKTTSAESITLGGDLRDPFVANSVLAWSATALAGRLSINEPGARAADAAAAAAQGHYSKTSASVLYLQALTPRWTLYASVLGQAASKNLDSSEKFALGGAQGVRAYPVGEAAGDEGVLATLELRYGLPVWLGATPNLVLFADSGRSRINKNQFAPGNNVRSLNAAGVGVTLVKTQDYAARFYWAARTSGGPATADTDRASRAWLQLAKYF